VTLIDTSAWIDFFRGQRGLADAVDKLLESGDAAICGPIVTELRRGLRSDSERVAVLPLLGGCHELGEPTSLWSDAGDLGFVLRRKGVTVKTLDLLIATHALAYDVPLLTGDADFEAMRGAGIPLRLAEPIAPANV
jgi:predicted nucleic acid-binding protein